MATLTVGPGSIFPSVAAVMAVAAAGDTIVIQAGYGPETATVSFDKMTFTGPGTGSGPIPPRVTLRLGAGVTTVTLAGNTPLDVLDNALGNTILSTDTNANLITVTDGADTVSGSGFASVDTLFVDYHLATGVVTGTWSAGFSEASGTRSVTIAGGASFQAMDIRTGSGNDDLRGAGSGFGSLERWAGNDRLEATTRWTLNGGPGADTLIFTDQAQRGAFSYAKASAGVTANLLNPLANTGEAAGDAYVYDGAVDLLGSVFNDVLTLGNGGGQLSGVQGDDTLIGGTGVDTLFGAAGLNHLIGGAGADSLNGAGGLSFASYATAVGGVDASMISPGANTGKAAGDSYVSIRGASERPSSTR